MKGTTNLHRYFTSALPKSISVQVLLWYDKTSIVLYGHNLRQVGGHPWRVIGYIGLSELYRVSHNTGGPTQDRHCWRFMCLREVFVNSSSNVASQLCPHDRGCVCVCMCVQVHTYTHAAGDKALHRDTGMFGYPSHCSFVEMKHVLTILWGGAFNMFDNGVVIRLEWENQSALSSRHDHHWSFTTSIPISKSFICYIF